MRIEIDRKTSEPLPEKRLLLYVILTAIITVLQGKDKKEAALAEEWIESDEEYTGSFVQYCDLADQDPGWIRRKIKEVKLRGLTKKIYHAKYDETVPCQGMIGGWLGGLSNEGLDNFSTQMDKACARKFPRIFSAWMCGGLRRDNKYVKYVKRIMKEVECDKDQKTISVDE
jgi:hypothetical protein